MNATELTVGQQAAVASAGTAAEKTTELILKAAGGESVTPRDLAEAAFEVALAGTSPLVGQKIDEYFAGMAKHLTARIAARAVDRYVGTSLGRAQRVAVMKAASIFVADRIKALGVSHFKKIANTLATAQEPDWNWWENVVAPLVGGGPLEQVIREAARKANAK